MSPLPRMLFIFVAVITLQATAAFGLEIEIKGLRLGMTKAEVEAIVGPLPMKVYPVPGFTIAGAQCTVRPMFDFYEGKLDSFTFFFNSVEFGNVLEAVKTKYPSIKCEVSTVTNGFGAKFPQSVCVLKGQLGKLILYRVVSDVSTSALFLQSYRSRKESDDKQKEKQKDL